MALPAVPITSTVDLSALRRLANPQRVSEAVREGMPQMGALLVPAMRAEMSHPEGPGAASLESRVRSDASGTTLEILGNSYLRYNLMDTKAHVIEPRDAQALRFDVAGGGIIFRKRVHHPGTKANRWDLRAWVAVRGEAVQILARALISRIGR